jgi:hypothetical protein
MLQSRAGNSTIKDSGFNINQNCCELQKRKNLGAEKKAHQGKLDEALAAERRR